MPDAVPSVETSIALLGLKIDSNQAETNAKLDGVSALVGEKMTNVEHRVDAIEARGNANTDRITKLENTTSRSVGMWMAVFSAMGVLLTTFGVWAMDHFTTLFK